MYLKKHTVLQKLFSEKYHWGGGTSSQDAKSSIWYKHKLTAWWRHNLMQLWEAYAWDVVTPHILQCCRDFFFFPRKCHLKHIYNWTQQRLWNWTGTAHLFEFFGKHFAGFFFFVSFSFCINFYQSMQLQCPRWRMHNKPYFFKKKKKKTSFCIKRYICHISPCSTVFKTILSKIQ